MIQHLLAEAEFSCSPRTDQRWMQDVCHRCSAWQLSARADGQTEQCNPCSSLVVFSPLRRVHVTAVCVCMRRIDGLTSWLDKLFATSSSWTNKSQEQGGLWCSGGALPIVCPSHRGGRYRRPSRGRQGWASVVNMQMNGLMGLKRSLRSGCVITQCQIKASSVRMCGCRWAAGQCCSWTTRSIKVAPAPVPENPANLVCCTSIKHNERAATDRQATKSQGIGERQTERIKSQRTNDDDDGRGWLDGVGGQAVWEQSILYDIFFYFIDMHPGEVNAIVACAVGVCLLDDWLVWHLILWLTVKDGVMESWEHPWPPPLCSPPPSIPLVPSSLLPPSFIYPFCCYISLAVLFPTQVPPKSPGEVCFCEFWMVLLW